MFHAHSLVCQNDFQCTDCLVCPTGSSRLHLGLSQALLHVGDDSLGHVHGKLFQLMIGLLVVVVVPGRRDGGLSDPLFDALLLGLFRPLAQDLDADRAQDILLSYRVGRVGRPGRRLRLAPWRPLHTLVDIFPRRAKAQWLGTGDNIIVVI